MRYHIGLVVLALLIWVTSESVAAGTERGATASAKAGTQSTGTVTRSAKAGTRATRPAGGSAKVEKSTDHKVRGTTRGRKGQPTVPGASRAPVVNTFAIDRCDSGWAALVSSRGRAAVVPLPTHALPERCSEGALVSLQVIATWSPRRLPSIGRRSRLEVVRWNAEEVTCRHGARIVKLPRRLVPGPLRRGFKLTLVVQAKTPAPLIVAVRQDHEAPAPVEVDLCRSSDREDVGALDGSAGGDEPGAALLLVPATP